MHRNSPGTMTPDKEETIHTYSIVITFSCHTAIKRYVLKQSGVLEIWNGPEREAEVSCGVGEEK